MHLIINDEKINIIKHQLVDTNYNKASIKRIIINEKYEINSQQRIHGICEGCQKEFSFQLRNKYDRLKYNLCKTCCQKTTFIEKYNTNHPLKLKNIQDKRKKTMLEKYGNYNNTEKIKQTNSKKTSKEKQIIKEKIKQTNIKKYGVDNPWKSEIIKEKIKQTNIKKYGVDNPWKSKKIQEKIKQTNIEKYGVDNFWKSKKFFNSRQIPYIIQIIKKYKNIVEPLFLLEDYKKSSDFYSWKCCECSEVFEDFLMNRHVPRCPKCFPKINGFSNMEKELADWIKSLNINIIENTRRIIPPLELDIYVPSKRRAIEFNGIYHHSELNGKNKEYHLNKTNLCQDKGVQLLHIFEDEWLNKQEIIKSIIKSKLGFYSSIIHGRRCTVKKISNKIANTFYDENHIQGRINSSVNLGLYHSEELVSCLSFSKPRFNKKYDWEITRFANKLNYKIHGSFSKLWSHKPKGSIITYSDKRLFTGEVYKKHMKQLSDSKPSYWYVKNGIRHSRLEFQKHKLSRLEDYNSNLTEWENMQLNGYDRIWDCGNHIFEYIEIADKDNHIKE